MQTLDLSGSWRLRWSDGARGKPAFAERDVVDEARYIDALVPGDVHMDLLRAGLIDDPYVQGNAIKARWVEDCIWSYRRFFDVPEDALSAKAWLVFEGLDYAATILLNGVEIAKHANTFYPCRVDVTGKLKAGRNLLTVHLDTGLYENIDTPLAGAMIAAHQRLHNRHWIRKPQFQFAWDWSTRLLNCGLFKPVRLEWTSDAVRADQFVPLAELSSDLTQGSLRARWMLEGLVVTPSDAEKKSETAIDAIITIELPEAGVTQSQPVKITAGVNPYEVTLNVTNPKLWWPIGHGEQHRYTVRATLSVDGKQIAQHTCKIGFRHVRINQDPHPQTGRYFIIEINGVKIFAKGGNFVPADMITANITKQRYEKLIDMALEQNFNLLRVWGGGLYESDDFYELCDARGILVWQEFIFACGKYPSTDKKFTDSVRAEARHNIRRLARYPSLVIWCGNNEMEWAAWDWGYDREGVILPDHAMFHLILPRIMNEEDPTRYYQPSSPFSPDGKHPNSDELGDQHPWSVGFAETDFRKYRAMISRFPNEGGILGPNALPTVLACLPEKQRFVQSFAWQIHDNSVDSWGEPSYPDKMLDQWLGKDIRQLTIEEYVYWAGLVQGEGLREYCENFHRRMFDSSSAIFWMYNDCWPTVRSWTTVDYYLRRTPAFHPVRRALAPVTVVVTQVGDEILVHGINETHEPVTGDLRFGILNLAGGYPVDQRASVTLAPNASTVLARLPMSQWGEPNKSAAFAMLQQGEKLVARARLFLPLMKELTWPAPKLAVSLENGRAVFRSDTFVWGVCLDLTGERALADNFFDVYPGIPYSIDWKESTPPQVLRVGNLV